MKVFIISSILFLGLIALALGLYLILTNEPLKGKR
jgi:hypothetical protein